MTVRLATRSWGGDDAVGEGVRGDGSGGSVRGDGVHGAVGGGGGDGGGAGGAAPLALLIHGVTSSSRTWWRVAPELVRRGYRVLAVDLRGHGVSPRAGEGLVLGDLAADVLATLPPDVVRPGADGDHLEGSGRGSAGAGGPAPIDLVIGHSLGALVALDMLGKVPGLARRLVLEEPAGPTGVDWMAMAEGIQADGRRARAEPEVVRRELAASNPAWDPREVDRRLADLVACDSDGVAAAIRGTTAFDLVGLAHAVRIPTLLVVGEESLGSALVGPDRKALADALADRVDFEVLEAGHNLHREAFASFMDLVDRWLRATTRTGEG